MIGKRSRYSLILAACSVFAGCGPIYSTEYSYVPPESSEGKTCVFQCQNMKFQCDQMQEMRNDTCQERAERQYYRCKDRGEKDCYRSYCAADYSGCESQYRSCYQACGGMVQEKQVCVGFCQP